MDAQSRRSMAELAEQASRATIARTPQTRLRPATVAASSGFYPPPSTAGPLDSQTQVTLDGDDGVTYAQNIVGEPLSSGQRVMCLFVPPHGCYVVGRIDSWPQERGLLASATLRHATVDTTLTMATGGVWTDLDAVNLAVSFIVPASGRVRVNWHGDVAPVIGTPIFWAVHSGTDAPPAGSAQAVGTVATGEDVLVDHSLVVNGLSPGTWTTWKWCIWHGNAAGAYYYHGPSYGALRLEVWGMGEDH